jgi:hypothetical protein
VDVYDQVQEYMEEMADLFVLGRDAVHVLQRGGGFNGEDEWMRGGLPVRMWYFVMCVCVFVWLFVVRSDTFFLCVCVQGYEPGGKLIVWMCLDVSEQGDDDEFCVFCSRWKGA